MRRLLAVLALLFCGTGAAQRLDHRGSLGLIVATGADYRAEMTTSADQRAGLHVPVDLGGTMAVGYDGDEVKLVARASFIGPMFGSLYGGYRNYFGEDAFKTFLDLDLRADLFPRFTIGPRVGLGVQYELSSLVGIYASLCAHVGGGAGVRFGAEANLGVQLRSYLLE